MTDRMRGLALTIHTTVLGESVLVELNRESPRGAAVVVPLETPAPWVMDLVEDTPEAPHGD